MTSSEPPESPQGARIEYADGRTTPLELRYVGQDDDGIHEWEIVTPIADVGQAGVSFAFDVFPARTSIRLPLG